MTKVRKLLGPSSVMFSGMSPKTMTLVARDEDDDAPARTAGSRVELLYIRHHGDVYRWAMRYAAGEAALAEDVVQEVFVKLLTVVDRLENDEELGRWLYRVTANRCLSLLRRRQLRTTVLRTFGLAEPHAPRLDERIAARASLARVFETMQTMPAKERIVFSMLYLDGQRQTDIARTLGYSKGYVSKLVHRAQRRVEALGFEVHDDE